MAMRVDAHELRELLSLTPPDQNIMLLGKHGIGKSEIITNFYRERGQRVVVFFLGQMSDPGDLIGLMNKDEISGRSVFMPPYWWPQPDEPIVLFLDELNRARTEILQAVQDLALNKTLAGKRLPAGSTVIAAVNEGDEYQLTELDPALVSRFNLYEFSPTFEEWLAWATEHDVDQRIIHFIQKHHQHLDGEISRADAALQNAGLIKTPDRRAWVKVSNFIKAHESLIAIHFKIIAGMVGPAATIALQQDLAEAIKLTPQQLLLNFNRYRNRLKDMSLHELILLNEQAMLWINSNKYKSGEDETIRKNAYAYLQYLQKAKFNEVVAHFASLLESANFAHATNLLSESLELIQFLTKYVEGIQV